ncbi:uncharacterized protein F4807DRAFT_156574 [Annulohypoxylon truncatum]|uniref:uncharacterized protein n=1 Tax=Annulohypoxylon truncatum TaxID=327061 RepID=UPI0020084339|nr:uncharacterized protein F4807DRAFT_156574 [Annulohypoxylon truncatum]KAI1208226.1 hypothetical protein F4807DRAFT_156574 [Annulohypoxylon truncatum]
MDISVNRVHVLVHQFRDKVRGMATLQRRIYCDMDVFIDEGGDVRSKFEETRQGYLNLLGLSVAELRQIMSTSELAIPTTDFDVEDIMKRVRPVTERYLRRLVNGGVITENDMECILVGGYSYVEDFFHDMDNNVGMFGLKESIASSEDVSGQGSDVAQSDGYDENGFFVVDELNANKEANETSNSTTVQPEASTITPPVVLLPPSEPFSWAEDVEQELESMEPVKALDRDSLAVAPLPTEEERSPVDASFPSDSSDTSSDVSSDFDFDISLPELIDSSLTEPQSIDPESEKKDDAEPAAEESDSKMPPLDMSEKTEQPIKADFPTYRSLSKQTDGDEILDEWLEEQEMWFWQYEALFLMTLAAQRYKRTFEEARGAYKADPFNDD